MKFEVNILGSNSALPTAKRFASCQVLNLREKLYMIDCGEGAQIQMRKQKLKFTRLNHIFISHLHGDHVFGLPGLITSFDLLGRTSDIHIYAHENLEKVMKPFMDFFAHGLSFSIIYHTIDPWKYELIYQDKSIEVYTLPLKHRIPTCGFLFKEKPLTLNIKREMIDFYNIGVKDLKKIKLGEDFVTNEGVVIPNERLTVRAKEPRAYAYCSDTMYCDTLPPLIENVNLLYHEATFGDDNQSRIAETNHSTAKDAARIAQLAKAKKLLIGHFSARYPNPSILENEAREIFKNSYAVEDGDIFQIE